MTRALRTRGGAGAGKRQRNSVSCRVASRISWQLFGGSEVSGPEAQALLDVLQRASLRRKLEAVAGYETARTGEILI